MKYKIFRKHSRYSVSPFWRRFEDTGGTIESRALSTFLRGSGHDKKSLVRVLDEDDGSKIVVVRRFPDGRASDFIHYKFVPIDKAKADRKYRRSEKV
jgi:hypothetical protein